MQHRSLGRTDSISLTTIRRAPFDPAQNKKQHTNPAGLSERVGWAPTHAAHDGVKKQIDLNKGENEKNPNPTSR